MDLVFVHGALVRDGAGLPTGHHPSLTRPDLVGDAIQALPRG